MARMNDEQIKQILNDGDEGDGPDDYWVLSFVCLHHDLLGKLVSHGPSYEFQVTNEVKKEIEAAIEKGGTPYVSKFMFVDTEGEQHTWYNMRVLGFFSSTGEGRRKLRSRGINGQLHYERLERDKREEAGMLWDKE